MSTNQGNNHQRPSPPRITINPSTPHSPGLFSTTASSSSTRLTPSSAAPTPLNPEEHHHAQYHTYKPPTTVTLDHILAHLRTPLHPLVSSMTGVQHPYFPRDLLAFHLLTSSQLDELARHYHQVWPPVQATFWYPVWVPGWLPFSSSMSEGCSEDQGCDGGIGAVDLATKRRRFGRFIGLRGCESPVREYAHDDTNGSGSQENGSEMLARMEREWQEALAKAATEELGVWREKGW